MAKGTVSKKKRANGLTWIYRYQTTRPSDGKQVEHTKTVGLVKNIGKSESDAWREVGRLGLDINAKQGSEGDIIFRAAAEHFRKSELKKKQALACVPVRRSPRTNFFSTTGFFRGGATCSVRKSGH